MLVEDSISAMVAWVRFSTCRARSGLWRRGNGRRAERGCGRREGGWGGAWRGGGHAYVGHRCASPPPWAVPPCSLSRHCLPHSLAGQLDKTCLWLEEKCVPPADHVSRCGIDSASSVCVCSICMRGAALLLRSMRCRPILPYCRNCRRDTVARSHAAGTHCQ